MNNIEELGLDGTFFHSVGDMITACGDVKKVSKTFGISEHLVAQIDIIRNKKYACTPKGTGPEHLKKYLVATRRADDRNGWDLSNPKILEARQNYDKGLGEIMTGRDGLFLNLYYIPRNVVRKDPMYFELDCED